MLAEIIWKNWQILGVMIIGVLLTIASIAFLAFGIVAIRLSKNEENPNMDNSNKFQS